MELCSPCFTGDLLVKGIESPLYDVILESIEGSRSSDQPNPGWNDQKGQPSPEGRALDTRTENVIGDVSAASSSKSTDKTGESSEVKRNEITSELLKERQRGDATLNVCRSKIGQVYNTKGGSTYSFCLSKGVLCQKYEEKGGKHFKQVVVPNTLSNYVLGVAHDSAMAGHQRVKRTTDRVLDDFDWPGVQADITHYVK